MTTDAHRHRRRALRTARAAVAALVVIAALTVAFGRTAQTWWVATGYARAIEHHDCRSLARYATGPIPPASLCSPEALGFLGDFASYRLDVRYVDPRSTETTVGLDVGEFKGFVLTLRWHGADCKVELMEQEL